MKNCNFAALLVLVLLTSVSVAGDFKNEEGLKANAVAHSSALEPARLAPEDFKVVKWAGTPAGNQRVDFAGDDKNAGMYAYRVRFATNNKVQPHFHSDDRIITVISGTLYVGYGEKFDESKMKALHVGSTWTEPAKLPHFVWAKDGEVVVQIVGIGPSALTQVPLKQ